MLKNLLYVIIILICSGNLLGQRRKPKLILTASVNDTLSVSVLEVTISDWLEFLEANNYDDSLFPDKNLIRNYWYHILFDDVKNEFRFLEPTKTSGFYKRAKSPTGFNMKPILKDSVKLKNENPMILPITGVSFKQAQAFCKWKEDYINSVSGSQNKVSIQLPSVELYKVLIPNTDSFCREKCDSCNRYQINYAHPKCAGKELKEYLAAEGADPVRVDSYWPTKEGLYCIQGNVAEMTNKEGIAMGGSYKQSARQSYNDHYQTYTHPESWIGFRFVVVYR